jgi:sugar phosphate isomerase/epimerase
MDTSLRGKDAEEAFRRASAAGAAGVEAVLDDKAVPSLGQAEHAAWLKRLAADNGLALPSLCCGFLCGQRSLIGTPQDIARSQGLVRKAISTARQAGAGVLLIPFFGKNSIEVESELTTAADAMLELVEPAEEAGVMLGIESNIHMSQQQLLLSHLGDSPNVRVYFDTGNALARKFDVAAALRLLGKAKLAQVHLKDVRISTTGMPPNFDVALGEGNVDFRAVHSALKAVGYDGWLVLETPAGSDPLASAKRNVEFVRKLIGA